MARAMRVTPAVNLFDSYHCSRYNTNTGVLTEAMFRQVFASIRAELDRPGRSGAGGGMRVRGAASRGAEREMGDEMSAQSFGGIDQIASL